MKFIAVTLIALHSFIPLAFAKVLPITRDQTNSLVKVSLNRPLCGPYSYSNGLTGVTSFCSDKDLEKHLKHSGLELFKSLVGKASARDVTFGFWAFSDDGWADQVCSLLTQRTVSINGAIDRGRGNIERKIPERLSDCSSAAHVSKSSVALLGRIGDFLEFHPKFLTTSLENGKSVTFTSTGNPTRNSEFNFDINLAFEEPTDNAPMFNWHNCAMGALLDDKNAPETSYGKASHRYRKCVDQLEARPEIGVTPFLLPFDKTGLMNRIAFLLGRSSRVSIAVQSADSMVIRDMLLMAMSYGTKVRLVRDDDLLYVGAQDTNLRDSDGELMNRQFEKDVWLKPLAEAGADIRYLATNNLDSKVSGAKVLGNFLHAKMIVFERPEAAPVVLLGSANLTDAAFAYNVENVYLIENVDVANDLNGFMTRLWDDAFNSDTLPVRNERPH